MKRNTSLIQAGQKFEPTSRAIIPPPYLTSTYVQESPGVSRYEYGRTDNPSFRNLEAAIAAIEKDAVDSVVFSSGTGAINAMIHLLEQGDEILCDNNTYSGTRRIFSECYSQFGIKTTYVDARDFQDFARNITDRTKLIWAETPTNPLLKINDIRELSKIAKSKKCLLGIDSTFATPINQSPLTLGADLVLYSTTKYMAGHSDVIGGAISSNDEELIKKLRWRRNALGLNPSPFDCWLIQRGVKTLSVRLQRHSENAMKLAQWFESNPLVDRVIYPGLKSFPQYELAKEQMNDFSGMVSAVFKLPSEKIQRFLMSLQVWQCAESLGGVESLVDYPWLMTQSGLSEVERIASEIPEGMVRFSTGIEDVEDLILDIESALTVAQE